ncbi:MAG: hypothetical protein FJ253_02980 [Phycisphaerae bacterium]|nr:hypothetical protein [Phycisphaerae bacterium]
MDEWFRDRARRGPRGCSIERAGLALLAGFFMWAGLGFAAVPGHAVAPIGAGDDAPPWVMEAQLAPDPGPPASQLGAAVAISAKRCAVGNRRDTDLGSDTGVVHCFDFVRKAWRLSQLLKDPAGCITCDFGAALAMDSDRLIVGAPRDGSLGFDAGRAHVFERRGTRWVLDATLARPSPGVDEHFGGAVAVRGRVAVIGAPRADLGAKPPTRIDDAGVAEVFELREGTWTHAATLLPPKPSTSAWFGAAVAAEGDRVAIGALGESNEGGTAGAVHIFRRVAEGWTHESTLTPPWPGPSWFGFSLAMDGDRLLVGAPLSRPPGSGVATGAAFLYLRTGSSMQLAGTLTAPWLAAGDGLGISTALDGDNAFVGASGDDEDGEDSGAVYLFARRAGSLRPAEKLAVPSLSAGDHCGAALAACAGRLIVGRGGDPEATPAPGQGAAWIFTPQQGPTRRSGSGSTKSAPSKPAASDSTKEKSSASPKSLKLPRAPKAPSLR